MITLYTPEELQETLRIPLTSIYELSRKKKIPGSFKVGRHWRYRKDDVDSWLEGLNKENLDD